MKKIVSHRHFKKDLQKIELLPELVDMLYCLINGKMLAEKYRDHQLTGNLKTFRECHIKPDLLLLYQIQMDKLLLFRLTNHSELFG